MAALLDGWGLGKWVKSLITRALLILSFVICILTCTPCVLQCLQRIVEGTVKAVMLVEQKGGIVGKEDLDDLTKLGLEEINLCPWRRTTSQRGNESEDRGKRA